MPLEKQAMVNHLLNPIGIENSQITTNSESAEEIDYYQLLEAMNYKFDHPFGEKGGLITTRDVLSPEYRSKWEKQLMKNRLIARLIILGEKYGNVNLTYEDAENLFKKKDTEKIKYNEFIGLVTPDNVENTNSAIDDWQERQIIPARREFKKYRAVVKNPEEVAEAMKVLGQTFCNVFVHGRNVKPDFILDGQGYYDIQYSKPPVFEQGETLDILVRGWDSQRVQEELERRINASYCN